MLDLDPMSARDRIASTRLYLVCDARPRAFLDAALRGGVDLIQLRDKTLADDELIAAARDFRAAADAAGALFILNDRPDLVECVRRRRRARRARTTRSVAEARAAVGAERIVGRSTHAPAQGAEADADPDVDYVVVGPGPRDADQAGPPGRGARDTSSGRRRTSRSRGSRSAGSTPATSARSTARGASRIVVVRAIAEAADPEAAARALRRALEAPVGAQS